jgi:uncharacterized protein (DUF1800 family)
MNSYSAEIAANRFGMGARAGELELAQKDAVSWLLKQIKPIAFDSAIGSLAKASVMLQQYSEIRKNEKLGAQQDEKNSVTSDKKNDRENAEKNDGRNEGRNVRKKGKNNNKAIGNDKPAMSETISATDKTTQKIHGEENVSPEIKSYRKISGDMIMAMQMEVLHHAITTPNSLSVRLLDFFSNHFSVSGQGIPMHLLAPLLEREAIAPHLSGYFSDMLLAVEQHPAMLVYLNNEKSIGPDSAQGKKSHKGLNENLGREILELHTLGVNGGYSQSDVRELAMAITGWSLVGPKEDGVGFLFRERAHQPGVRKIVNKNYAQAGVAQGEAILKDLAVHPATAQHLSFKLARHFIADKPSEKLVAAMKTAWLETTGNITAVIKIMLEHPDSWLPEQQKYKTPREFIISTMRIVESFEPLKLEKLKLVQGLRSLGQEPYSAGSPAGYGDTASSWDGAEALMARIEWVSQVAAHSKARPIDLMTAALGKQLTEHTLKFIKGAESGQQGLALAFMSPEFQRR